jgi:hypothetical protein
MKLHLLKRRSLALAKQLVIFATLQTYLMSDSYALSLSGALGSIKKAASSAVSKATATASGVVAAAKSTAQNVAKQAQSQVENIASQVAAQKQALVDQATSAFNNTMGSLFGVERQDAEALELEANLSPALVDTAKKEIEKNTPNISSLSLTNQDEFNYIVRLMLDKKPQEVVFSFANCNLDAPKLKMLVTAISGQELNAEIVDLSGNPLTDQSAPYLAELLQKCRAISYIILQNTNLTSAGMLIVLQAISDAGLLSNVQFVDFSGNAPLVDVKPIQELSATIHSLRAEGVRLPDAPQTFT